MRYAETEVLDYLPPTAWKTLETFTASARISRLRPRDWRLFYDFVRTCHANQALLSKESLFGFLTNNGFADDVASELGSVYLHGRALLAEGGMSGNGEVV